MAIQKLLQLTIVDALDEVWSKSGVIPSKKTRKTIIKAAEIIANGVHEDFIKAGKKRILNSERWENVIAIRHVRKMRASDSIEPIHDEVDGAVPLLNI